MALGVVWIQLPSGKLGVTKSRAKQKRKEMAVFIIVISAVHRRVQTGKRVSWRMGGVVVE